MIIACESCGQKNRIPSSRLHVQSRCGKCKATLGPVGQPLDIASVAEFDDLLEHAEVPLLVDFWAPWCGPCRMAAPQVEATAKQSAGRALVLKVNTDTLPELGSRYGVRGIPNFIVFGRGGQIAHQQAGLVNAQVMQQWLGAAT